MLQASRVMSCRRPPFAVAVAAVGLAAAGCASANTSGVDDVSTANPEECDNAALDALYEKAQEEEGAVLWYYTSPPEQIEPIQDAFSEAYPGMSLDYAQVVGLGVPARIIQELEAGRESADFGAGGANELVQMRERGLAAVFDAEELGLVNPELLPAPDTLALSTSPSVLVYNTNLVPDDEVPTTWDELADGTWDGGFGVWQFPYTFAQLASTWGEDEATDYVETLAAKEPFLYQSNFPLAADIGAGKTEIGIGKYHTTLPTIESGAPVELAFLEPVPIDTMATYLSTESLRPNSTKLFLAWALCGEGAKILESSTGVGNALVPGTEMSALLVDRETSEWEIDQVSELTRLLDEYGAMLRSGGVEVTTP